MKRAPTNQVLVLVVVPVLVLEFPAESRTRTSALLPL
jgi:hypothetical protein